MPGSGRAIGRQYEADDLAIGPLTWKRVTLRKARRTETNIADGDDVFEASIGIAALRQLNLIIDRTNHLAYVRPNPDWVSSQEAHRKKCLAAFMISSPGSQRATGGGMGMRGGAVCHSSSILDVLMLREATLMRPPSRLQAYSIQGA